MNQIVFNIQDGGRVKISFKKQVPLNEFLQIIATGTLAAMNAAVKNLPQEEQLKAKEEIYDLYNIAASNTLAIFAPEIEYRPNLTAQAILEAENKILERGNK